MNAIEMVFNSMVELTLICMPYIGSAAISALLIAMIVLPVNILFGRWMAAWQMNLLWGLVLLRLLIPIGPGSAWSFQSMVISAAYSYEAQPVTHSRNDPIDFQVRAEEMIASTPAFSGNAAQVTIVAPQEVGPSWAEIIWNISSSFVVNTWLVVAVLILMHGVVASFLFRRKVNTVATCDDQRLCNLWRVCCERGKIRRTIPIVLLDAIPQPAVAGVVRTKLLLPTDAVALADTELQMIMFHELAHVRRWDLLINWLLLVARAIHWFNPVYWLAARRFATTREKACDAFVLRQMNDIPAPQYGQLLVKLAQQVSNRAGWKVRLSAPLLGYFFGSLRRRAVAARLRALPRAAVRRGWWQVATVALFTLLLSYCGLTNAKPEEPPSVSSDAQSIQFDGKTYRNLDELRIAKPGIFAPLSSSIMERKEYDVATMMKRLTGDGHSIDQAQQLLLAAIQQIHPEPSSYSVKRIKFREGKLLATGTPDAHAELTRKLKLWESAGLSVQIRVELGYLSLAKNETEQLAAEWKNIATRMPVEWPEEEMLSAMEDTYVAPDPFESPAAAPQKVWAQSPKPGGPPFIYALLSPNQAKVAIDCAEMRNSAVAATPQLLLNGTGGEFKSVTQLPLTANMKGFEGAAESFQVGSKLQVQPTLSEDQKQIPLDTRIELRQADMANAPTVREEGKVIPIPSIKAMFTGGRFDLEDGHSLLIGSTQSLQGGADSARYHYFLLTAKKVTGATVSK